MLARESALSADGVKITKEACAVPLTHWPNGCVKGSSVRLRVKRVNDAGQGADIPADCSLKLAPSQYIQVDLLEVSQTDSSIAYVTVTVNSPASLGFRKLLLIDSDGTKQLDNSADNSFEVIDNQ
jgi:hypothetical protein